MHQMTVPLNCPSSPSRSRPAAGGTCDTGAECANVYEHCDQFLDHCTPGMQYYNFMTRDCKLACQFIQGEKPR